MTRDVFFSSSMALLVATIVGRPVAAFFPPWVNAPIGTTPIAAETSATPPTPPPKDDTFRVIGSAREFLAAPDEPKGVDRYDEVGLKTGGTWRTNAFGFLPSTVVASPLGTPWITKQEAIGSIAVKWTESISKLLGTQTAGPSMVIVLKGDQGPKSLSGLSPYPDKYTSVRRVYDDLLSTSAVLELKPSIEAALAKRVPRWDIAAATGEPLLMHDEISSFTLEVISACIVGDYAPALLSKISELLPVLAEALVSVPRRMPWPLNILPAFAFGHSMDSRDSFREVLLGVLQERKAEMSSNTVSSKTRRKGGMIDTLLEMQKEQVDAGGAEEGELVLDDDFVIDNIVSALFAGFHTTSALLTRVFHVLGSPDCKGVVEELVKELNGKTGAQNGKLANGVSGVKPVKNIFGEFPFLDAVVLETFRVHPAAVGVMRTALRDIEYNGYEIAAGSDIQWNILSSCRSASLYPEPQKFCPFRFLHKDTSGDKHQDGSSSNSYMTPKEDQQRPQMFGFGRRMCPGRELAKLEILLFTKTFLSRFDYDLVKGQSFKGMLPTNAPKGKLRVVLRPKARA